MKPRFFTALRRRCWSSGEVFENYGAYARKLFELPTFHLRWPTKSGGMAVRWRAELEEEDSSG
jgi:hypothetical protein